MTAPTTQAPISTTEYTGTFPSGFSTVTTTTQATTTDDGTGAPFCADKPAGYFPDPDNCEKYYLCSNGAGSSSYCAGGTIWDPVLNICNWMNQVDQDALCISCPNDARVGDIC